MFTTNTSRTMEFDNNNTLFQANIATKLLDNLAAIIKNSQILKDKQ